MYEWIRQIDDGELKPAGLEGISYQVLSGAPDIGASVTVYHFSPGASIPAHFHAFADETALVLEGDFIEDGKVYGAGAVLFGPAGCTHGPHRSESGCKVMFSLSGELDFNPVAPQMT